MPLDLEHICGCVRLPQLMRVFVYEHDAVLGGVDGLAEMVREERADWTETEDMEAHWPVWMSRGRLHQTELTKESSSRENPLTRRRRKRGYWLAITRRAIHVPCGAHTHTAISD